MRIKHLTLLAILFSSFTALHAQKKDSAKTATLDVNVTNGKKEPRKGELVVLLAAKTHKAYIGHTDAKGRYVTKVPVGDDYTVTVTTLADTTQFGVVPVPSLGEGQFYKDAFKVNIEYEPARSFTLDNVQFDNARASLRPASYKELDELVEYMKWKETEKIEIAGHTDNVGRQEDNLKLSQLRAEAVKNYLVKKGIAPARITSKGYGADQPIADNSTEEGRQQNRRTEVKIL